MTEIGYTVDETEDEFGVARFFVASPNGDWEGDPFDTIEQANSVAKTRNEIVARHGCCKQARLINCVCMYAFDCPEHGAKHIGTHD